MNQTRPNAFDEDVQQVMTLLDASSVEKVAKQLGAIGTLDMDAVAKLIDRKLPWQ